VWTLRFEADPNGTNLRLPRQADRLTLRTILLTGLEGRVHFGQAAACAESTPEGATLCFADGSSTHASLVVGANGAHSVLREQLLPDCAPVDTGHLAIYGRALVPTPLANSGVLAVGAPGRVFFFTTMHFHESPPAAFARLMPGQPPPFQEDYVMWALGFPNGALPPNVCELDAEALHHLALKAARDFHPVLRRFVERADIDWTIAVPLHAAPRPTTWSVSRATLMGDAVHVMLPFGAHGGNTALRDAALLSEKLQAAAHQPERAHALGDAAGSCRKFSFEAICGMVSPSNPCSEGGERRWRSASKGPIFRKILS
jgi:2-polyprenyl-6-methoxyphenol hydroxylase-like FAD-dependent oxidoreductase